MAALFLITRALDIIYTSLIERGVIKKRPYDYVLLFTVLKAFCGYNYSTEPGNIDEKYKAFNSFFLNMDKADWPVLRTWIEIRNRELQFKGIEPHDPYKHFPQLNKFKE